MLIDNLLDESKGVVYTTPEQYYKLDMKTLGEFFNLDLSGEEDYEIVEHFNPEEEGDLY